MRFPSWNSSATLLTAAVFRLIACSVATLDPAGYVAECSGALDCALSGDCINGTCHCDPGWKTPDGGGTPCSAFDLLPADPDAVGYRNDTWPSWGGHPVHWAGDDKWHLFTPQFANECSVDQWIHNSFIVHAVGDTPLGPWRQHDVAIPVFSHASQAVQDPRDGRWLVYFVGGWHYGRRRWASCLPGKGSLEWPREPAGRGLGPTPDGCGPDTNPGCGLRVAAGPSPFGPWTVNDVVFDEESTPPPAKELTCDRSVPGPYILPNGTVMLSFGSGGCVGGLETIGVASAPSWNATYRFTDSEPIASPSDFTCPTGQLAEDPAIWHDGRRGWHLIAHGLCSWHFPGDNRTDSYAMHAYSTDAKKWTVAKNAATGYPALAWSKHVPWTNGSLTYISRMERPQVVLDPATRTRPLFLTTSVCVGGASVGSCKGHPSWALYRAVASDAPSIVRASGGGSEGRDAGEASMPGHLRIASTTGSGVKNS